MGDVVCLLMPNRPQYVAIWLGITQVGGVVSLLNTNLSGDSLAYAINIVSPKYIIVAAELADNVAEVLPQLTSKVATWVYGDEAHGFPRIDQAIAHGTGTSLAGLDFRAPTIGDRALYIYTSGTTGLPKAANVSHFRLMQWSYWFAGLMDTQPSDRMFNCLPMYHSVGGVAAIGSMLVNGGSVVIKPRFSASRFWDEIAESDCTLFQYIGELCRYLVNAPRHPREAEHRLRLCCGNGLRADVWPEFKRRFRIAQILEFYASTEGNVSLYNCEGKPGAIGRVPSFLAHRTNLALVKYDFEADAPLRNDEGLCERCQPGEIGEAIGRIPDDGSNHVGRFEGYADHEASERKILRDVFAPRDAWFRTGDLMRRDEKGYYYFVDRVGDTFRWKGENVSAGEVATNISACPGVLGAIVYGVAIPATDGRAGMVTLVAGHGFTLEAFYKHLNENLPEYARPMFLRLRDTIETTATFKSKAHELRREGYDPAITGDAIFFRDRLRQAFVKLDAALYKRIEGGDIRL
jgi:fatty-acyl-CoA synthase